MTSLAGADFRLPAAGAIYRRPSESCDLIACCGAGPMRGGWTYIMTNRPNGVLYVGVTSDLAARIAQHRSGEGSDFCRKYRLTRLILAEPHDTIDDAIRREKMLKAWKRQWKIELIEAANPHWRDLSDQLES